MVMTTVNTSSLISAQVAELVVLPSLALTTAANPYVSTRVTTSSTTLRVPRVVTDPTAAFVAEGAEIPVSDQVTDEVDVSPAKLAALTILTSELANDSSPAAAQQVGQGLARTLALRMDQAFWGNLPAPAPAGIGALSGVQSVVAAGAFNNTDAFAKAVSLAETVGAETTAFIVSPATALLLAQVKEGTGSNKALFGADATVAGQRQILGRPLLVDASVPANTAWAIDSSRVLLVVREDAQIVTDGSAFFTSDKVAIRAIMRVGFGFIHPQSVVKITIA